MVRLGEIDLNKVPSTPKLFLCRPDKTVIRPLNDINGITLSTKLGKINEINFSIPAKVERKHTLIENPLIDEIKHRYIIKLVYNNITEYFIHFEQNKKSSDSGKSISYKSFGLGYLLADKDIRSYEATSKSLTQIASDILSESTWKVNYVDADFDVVYRSHEIPNATVLQAIYEIAEKFNSIIIWDTQREEINFYRPDRVGINKGLRFKENKYLESFDLTSNAEETVTRLKVYGKDGLTFRNLSPTGSNYLEDFSWYMYPFKADSTGKVISHSEYMSDSLCLALEAYGKILANKKDAFDNLVTNKTAKIAQIAKVDEEITVLKKELAIILDRLDVLNSTLEGVTPEHTATVAEKDAKIVEVEAKESWKATLEGQDESFDAQINTLRDQVDIEKNLTGQQLKELNKFIITKSHTNDTIVDEKDLLKEGIEVFESFREPKVSLNMSIVDFLTSLESQNDWDKLTLGDTVHLESKALRVSISSKIIEINHDFDSDSINLTIANEKEIKDDYKKLIDMIYNSSNTSTIVNMDKWKWDMIDDVNGTVNKMLSQAWDANKNAVVAGYKQNIMITERGLIAKSDEDPMSWLILQNGMLSITNDNGNSWKNAITKNGCIREKLLNKNIRIEGGLGDVSK